MPIKQPRKLDADELRHYAMKLLSSRALSIGEFKAKLRLRAADPASIDEIVLQLKEYGALNDQRYAGHFAETRAGSGAVGKQRVLSDLMRKKVAPKVAEKAVSEAYAGTDEVAMVEQWLERKYRNQDLGALLQEPAKLASVFRRLRQAGFSTSPSIRVLKRYAAEAEQLEDMTED